MSTTAGEIHLPDQAGLLHDQPAGWFVVVERETHQGEPMDPYIVGPFGEAEADEELQSDSGIVFCLLTIDAKTENYVAYDCYSTSNPSPGSRIIPVRSNDDKEAAR